MSEHTGHWRAMRESDLDGVVRIARLAFPDHFEDRSCFAERLALYPKGCFVLDCGPPPIAGYLIAYPWTSGSVPPLNSLIGQLPHEPDLLYLHDLALDPALRGLGLTRAVVERLAEQAAHDGWCAIALVAVNRAADFWRKAGFAPVDDHAMAQKLASYGEGAIYMKRAVSAE